jgi:drug/metabolite transporter superfamily protein YnfA
MTPLLPTALLPVASALALLLVWPRLRTQPSNGRLFAEAFGLALVAIAVVWSAWVGLWLMEQHDAVLVRLLP